MRGCGGQLTGVEVFAIGSHLCHLPPRGEREDRGSIERRTLVDVKKFPSVWRVLTSGVCSSSRTFRTSDEAVVLPLRKKDVS